VKKGNPNTTSSRKAFTWMAIVIFILVGSMIVSMLWQQNLRIQSIQVKGNHFTSEDDILAAYSIPLNSRSDGLDLGALVQELESLDYVQKVIPYINALGTLIITVVERTPIALLIDGDNESYIDAYGVKLPIIPTKQHNLPLVYGFDATMDSSTISSQEFTQIRDFLVSAKNNQFGWITISEVAFDPLEGVIALSHENGVKLLFGKDNFDQKLQKWETFYSKVIAYKGIQTMQKIDLRFVDQIITQEEES
jgi:cell division septal protein FtsQ